MDIPPQIVSIAADAAPGAIGSGVAAIWFKGPLIIRIAVWAGGAGIAYYGALFTAWWLQIEHAGAVGFIGMNFGLFGIACASKIYDMISSANAKDTVTKLIDAVIKRLGG